MSDRAAAWLAWSLAALSVAVFAASVVLEALARSARTSYDAFTAGDVSAALFLLFLAFPIVGALVASRRPLNPIGWILLVDGLLWMLLAFAESYRGYGVASPGSIPFPGAIGALGNTWLWVPTAGLLGIYVLLLFPDGKLPSRRWRPLAFFSGVVIVLLSVAGGLAPGPLENQGGEQNPFGIEALPWLVDVSYIVLPLLPLCILASAVSMVLRFRRSSGEERQQIKWIAFVASLTGLLYLCAMVIGLAVELTVTESGESLPPTPWWFDLLFSMAVLGFAGVPVAIGFAILRYRLYDIDIIINRTLVYGSLTAMLLAIYFGVVATTQTLFRALTGQEQQPQIAVVVSTLAIAALFNPLRKGIQSFIDRRFYRHKYDARRTVEAFSARLRDETDLETLNRDLAGVVEETLQPAHVSLWLRSDDGSK
jgi:MFS family permease